MKKVAIIPARYAATRFPGKLMQRLGQSSVIIHTYKNVVKTGLFSEVLVATDSEIIFEEITVHGGNAVMTKKDHESGSDRIAEVAKDINAGIIVNVQGDTPFVKKDSLENLIRQFDDPSVQVASMMRVLKDQNEINNPNFVKVAVDKKMNSLFFSRSTIPYLRNSNAVINYYEHIGVYAFRKQALLNFSSWPITPLEDAEKIECLRYLEYGIPLRMTIVNDIGIEIDTPEDLERATKML